MESARMRTARARSRLSAEVRRTFDDMGYEEVETPCLVPAPGMEPHLDHFLAPWRPGEGTPRPLWLQSSPEYAMKRLLADGWQRIYQLARVFRNGELSATHNPEFTMLELYRAGTGYLGIMEDLEVLVERCARALLSGGARVERSGRSLDLAAPFDRITMAEAFSLHAGVELAACDGDAAKLREAARAAGHDPGRAGEPFDDV